jgi:aldose sugar dehydrogenase
MKNYLLSLIGFYLIACSTAENNQDEKIIGYLDLGDTQLAISEQVANLEVPWDIDTNVPGVLWYTELKGNIHRMDLATAKANLIFQVPDLIAKKSYGLLGMAVDPTEKFVFLHYTFAIPQPGQEERISSRLVRYAFENGTLKNPLVLMDSLPGATYHNGSRIAISGDFLYFSLGDVGKTDLTQDPDFYGGKVFRLHHDGKIPADNPFPGNPVYAVGFRNTQGLALAQDGRLYGTDHGPLNDDEVNLIEKGRNYGWPDVHGYCDTAEEKIYCAEHRIAAPLRAWTPTLATAGLAIFEDSKIPALHNTLIMATMKGRSLRFLKLSADGRSLEDERIFLQETFGRIRDVSVSAKGEIFFSTTNRDWHPRFQPWMYANIPEGPDRIIKLRIVKPGEAVDSTLPIYTQDEQAIPLMDENWSYPVSEEYEVGSKLYVQHCLACHGPEGKGAEDLIPPLAGTEWVTGDKGRLIRILLHGLSGEIIVNGNRYNQEMPAYAHLSDEEIADILNFLRNNFGNKAAAVIPGEVYEERKGLK